MTGAPPNACGCPYSWGQLLPSPPPVENRQKLRAEELRREYHEEQRNEFENFVEEQDDGKSSSAGDFWELEACGKTMWSAYTFP